MNGKTFRGDNSAIFIVAFLVMGWVRGGSSLKERMASLWVKLFALREEHRALDKKESEL